MKKWITKNDEEMNISDMSDTHLINAAKMVARTKGEEWEELFLSEFRKRKLSIKPIREVEDYIYEGDEIDGDWFDQF